MTMNKCKLFLITIALILFALWVGIGSELPLQPFCPFHKITGIPCPGCGGIRAANYLMSGDIRAAIMMNPLSVVICVIIPIMILWAWIDVLRKKDSLTTFLNKRWKKSTIIIIFAIIIINWVWNIYKSMNQ